MEMTTKGIRDPFNQNHVDVRATGEVYVNQDSKLKIRVKNNNSEIGITDNNSCFLFEKDGVISQVTLNPQNKEEFVFTSYYKDEDGILHKKGVFAVVNLVQQEIDKKFLIREFMELENKN